MINGIPRILIVRLSAIGDVVRVLPALHSIRASFPNAQIDWAVERRAAEIVEGHPDLDHVLVFERPPERKEALKAFWSFCAKVREGRYEIVIDFHGILKSGLITLASRASDRYGFARPRAQEASYLFTNHRVKLPSADLNRVEENLLLADALGPRNPSPEIAFFVPDDVKDEVERFFERNFDSGKRVVAVHVAMDRPEKAWPADYFAKLCEYLVSDGRFEVVLTWAPGQREQVEAVLAHTRRSPQVGPEMTSLKYYIWLIHCADLYFGGDTGPMHIATAVGTPVVAVFGGTDPAKHAPFRPPYRILTAEDCAENPAEAAKLSGEEKLRLISPEAAYDACVALVDDGATAGA